MDRTASIRPSLAVLTRSWAGGALAAATLLTACAPRRVAEQLALGRTVRRIADVPYGAGAQRALDVYVPRDAVGLAPVVVFIYGGRWKYGSKRDYLFMGNALARRGWVVVLPEYRRYPAALFPAWVEDGAQAVRWARDHATAYGGDTARVFVVGHSAGAHTAALLALDERWLRDAGVPAGAVRGFVSMAGPVDTTWTARDVQRLMGPREGWPATYPATHVDGAEPPLLLLHGSADDVVGAANSLRLAERIRARGGCARAIVYPGLDHVGIATALGLPWLTISRVPADVARFVRDPASMACRGAR